MKEKLKNSALVIVDEINSFFPERPGYPAGELPVPGAHEIVPVTNKLIRLFEKLQRPIVAANEDHEDVSVEESEHFKKFGRHGIRGTRGAEFYPDLNLPKSLVVFYKGSKKEVHGYSGFEGYTKEGLSLEKFSRSKKVNTLVVVGLAIDYCVGNTVRDALKVPREETGEVLLRGDKFNVIVVSDAIKAVNYPELNRGEVWIGKMKAAGAIFMTSSEVIERLV